ncbi:MAG: hypothetical protein JO265_03795, partial [Acidimicrobiia bacterium]|nr:hypothetical protein [Acidimicrobiia bacterium]
ASWDLAFPPPAPPPPSQPLDHPLPILAGPTSATSASSHGGGSGFPTGVVLVLVLAAGAAAAAWFVGRRRSVVPDVAAAGPEAATAVPVSPVNAGRVPAGAAPPTTAAAEGSPGTRAPVPPSAHEPFVAPPLDAPVVVRFLGPRAISGWKQEPKSNAEAELLEFLASRDKDGKGQRQGVTNAELRLALYPRGSRGSGVDVSPRRMHNRVSDLRRALGAEHVPDAREGGPYRVGPGVLTDWDEAQVLLARSARPEQWGSGLMLVTGELFGGELLQPEWADGGFAARVGRAVTEAAERLFAYECQREDFGRARSAADQGVKLDPHHFDLHVARLKADRRLRDRGAFEADLKEARAGVPASSRRALEQIADELRREFDEDA